jgi:mannan endo-1,4-beta-mannosidase
MKKLFLFLLLVLSQAVFSQASGLVENFTSGDISKWTSDGRTFQLAADSGTLKITYTRTASSGQWDNFHFAPSVKVNMSGNPLITVKVKSNVRSVLTFKPIYDDNTSDWLQQTLKSDNNWYTLQYNTTKGSKILKEIYLYLDGGSSTPSSGVVRFEEIRLGDSATIPVNLTILQSIINSAQLLMQSTKEGNGEGEYPAGSKAVIQSELVKANAVLTSGTKDQKIVEQAAWDLADICTNYEKNVKAVYVPLYDKSLTKETRYLYANLEKLSRKALVFGMHDATGYGVGWTGDDDRSDVKSVCGDYPGMFSEDAANVERDLEVDRMRYRLSTAYNNGAVITLCWHQYDPDNRGFYATDVNNERIVSTILPGGARHTDYTAKLRKIAIFFKTLRGQNGETIPVIFRPYHEHYGDWFWWGPPYTTTQEYIDLWRFTADYLRDSCNVHNLIYAISPSLDQVGSGSQYYSIYPGDNYVDIFGTDYYFGDVISDSDRQMFSNRLRVLAGHSVDKNKIVALTEVGEQGLKTADFFTSDILAPVKNDTVVNKIVYSNVWRNESVNHFFAPYPGHSSVPDFIKFYNDPYTLFEKDLPKMYELSGADTIPPVFVSKPDSTILSPDKEITISLTTDERAFLRYSFTDQDYSAMPNVFSSGEGGYSHSTTVIGTNGAQTIFVRAQDAYGNAQKISTPIRFIIDTLEKVIAWTDPLYPVKDWNSGLAPMGTKDGMATKLLPNRTVYFRKKISVDVKPSGAAIMVSSYGGAAAYINGKEIGRFNLPANTDLLYNTSPLSNAQFNKAFTLDSNALAPLKTGENIISVEVHVTDQNSIQKFDANFFDAQYNDIIPLGAEWAYFDKGYRPVNLKLRDIISAVEAKNEIPSTMRLYGNYPNPFNPSTTIRYSVSAQSKVTLEIYDILGRRVASLVNKVQQPGLYEVQFNGARFASGVYLAHFKAGNYTKTHKIMLLK